jgi:leucyl-tRNA synthetase
MHLLYARMWTKVMADSGLINFREPFSVLRNQGIVAASDGSKMSKSKGNVVTPDEMIDKYGADALRLWELFMSPFDEATHWNEDGVAGTSRYLMRVWTMVRRYVEAGAPAGNPTEETIKRTHKTIQTVTDHLERLRFNTALAAMMDQLNYLAKLKPEELGRFALEAYIVMLAAMAPHITEEIWRALGHEKSIHLESWPNFDPELIKEETVTVVIQINGKVRDRLQVDAGAPEADVIAMARVSDAVKRHLDGREPKKVIYVPGKLVSIVV